MQDKNDISWITIVSRYNYPDPLKSWVQLLSNILLYSLGFFLMIISLSYSYWLTMGLVIPVAGILVRIFINFHDCCHGSFFKSRKLNKIIGYITGILTFTPYSVWSENHMIHHKTAGNLDKRGTGDVYTMTVREYFSSSRWNRIKYRIYRNPAIMFGIGSFLAFIIIYRFTNKEMDTTQKMGVYITNGGLFLIAGILSFIIGIKSYLIIQLSIMFFAGIMGFWLFYVQHQFDPSYWTHDDTWDYKKVALEGSSYYKLPGILRWFTGNIGYHHIHHLSPKIPNYKLRKCHEENELFRNIKPLNIRRSLKAIRFRLWDEEHGRMVGFRN